jgi:MFS family permease
MEDSNYKVYGYRWVVLLAFMGVVAINQLLWITFAPITTDAARFYGVSELSIGVLSLSFMLVYIIVSIPASWAIDTYGLRTAVGLGAVLTGAFGLLRGFAGSNYTLVLLAQIGIAIGQPLILNAVTTVAARWFPPQERATAAGLGSLAIYLGIIVGLALTPYLSERSGINGMLLVYGVVSVIAVILFFAFARERPVTPPCPPGQDERSLVLDGLKQIVRQRDFVLLMVVFFVGLGAFNAVTTWIEEILRPRGFSTIQAGDTGGLMILGGIIGALVIPILSDHYRRRTPFLIVAVIGAMLGLFGVTYAQNFAILLVSAAVLGFFLLSAGPVGFQYGAEITFPAPEGTSNGLLLMMGQISGIIFILGMDSFKSPQTGAMTMPLLALMLLLVFTLLVCTRLREPAAIKAAAKDQPAAIPPTPLRKGGESD